RTRRGRRRWWGRRRRRRRGWGRRRWRGRRWRRWRRQGRCWSGEAVGVGRKRPVVGAVGTRRPGLWERGDRAQGGLRGRTATRGAVTVGDRATLAGEHEPVSGSLCQGDG